MGHYKSNVRDLEFNLFEVFGRQDILGKGIYEDVDVDAAKDILHEVARLAENELADSLLDSDRNPPTDVTTSSPTRTTSGSCVRATAITPRRRPPCRSRDITYTESGHGPTIGSRRSAAAE